MNEHVDIEASEENSSIQFFDLGREPEGFASSYEWRRAALGKLIPVIVHYPNDYPNYPTSSRYWNIYGSTESLPIEANAKNCLELVPGKRHKRLDTMLFYSELFFCDDWPEFDIYCAIELIIRSDFGYMDDYSTLEYRKKPPHYSRVYHKVKIYCQIMYDINNDPCGPPSWMDHEIHRPCVFDSDLFFMDYEAYKKIIFDKDRLLKAYGEAT
jgi:hypothetical protein